MPFTSAELKTLAEEAWALGIPLSASQAAHYFYYDQLSELIDQATDIVVARRTAVDAYNSTNKAIQRLQEQIEQLTSSLQHADYMQAHFLALYRDIMVELDLYDERAFEIRHLENEIADLQYQLNEALIYINETEDALEDALDERDWAEYMMDVYSDSIDYWEGELYYCRRDYEECLDDPDCYYSEACDLEEAYEQAEDNFNMAQENFDDADDRYAYWRREVYDLEDQLDYYTDRHDDAGYQLYYIASDLAALQDRQGDLGQLTTDRYNYHDSYIAWRDDVITYTGLLATARADLNKANIDILSLHKAMLESNAAWTRMIDRWW